MQNSTSVNCRSHRDVTARYRTLNAVILMKTGYVPAIISMLFSSAFHFLDVQSMGRVQVSLRAIQRTIRRSIDALIILIRVVVCLNRGLAGSDVDGLGTRCFVLADVSSWRYLGHDSNMYYRSG